MKVQTPTDNQILKAWESLTTMERAVVSQHRREGKSFHRIAKESLRATSTISTLWYRACRKIATF